jgi:glycosyltransferase involved in cell wall biosynthesis
MPGDGGEPTSVGRVDIGMPTRGGGPFIGEAIESILAQTFEEWRLVVSENGPGSPDVAEQLAPYLVDPRIEHQTTGVDLGMAGNHTRLIQTGSAPYVALLHDDDRWESQFLHRRVELLDEHPEAAFAFGRYFTIDEHGAAIAEPDVPLEAGVHPPCVVLPLLVRRNFVGMPTIVVRRSAYAAVGDEFVADVPMIDYEMWCRLAARFPVAFLDVTDAGWRWHRSQTSQRVSGWGEQWLRFYSHLDTIVRDAGVAVDDALLRRRRAASSIAAALDALEVNERERAWEYLRAAIAEDRRSLLDPRVAVMAAALPFGRLGARPVLTLRRLTRWGRGRVGPLRVAARERVRVRRGERGSR